MALGKGAPGRGGFLRGFPRRRAGASGGKRGGARGQKRLPAGRNTPGGRQGTPDMENGVGKRAWGGTLPRSGDVHTSVPAQGAGRAQGPWAQGDPIREARARAARPRKSLCKRRSERGHMEAEAWCGGMLAPRLPRRQLDRAPLLRPPPFRRNYAGASRALAHGLRHRVDLGIPRPSPLPTTETSAPGFALAARRPPACRNGRPVPESSRQRVRRVRGTRFAYSA